MAQPHPLTGQLLSAFHVPAGDAPTQTSQYQTLLGKPVVNTRAPYFSQMHIRRLFQSLKKGNLVLLNSQLSQAECWSLCGCEGSCVLLGWGGHVSRSRLGPLLPSCQGFYRLCSSGHTL